MFCNDALYQKLHKHFCSTDQNSQRSKNQVTFTPETLVKIVSEYDQEKTHHKLQTQLTRGIVRKSHTSITRHQEDKQSKATSSLFPIWMIAKLEWTQSNAQQNIEQLQNPTMGVTINNESTTIEPPP